MIGYVIGVVIGLVVFIVYLAAAQWLLERRVGKIEQRLIGSDNPWRLK